MENIVLRKVLLNSVYEVYVPNHFYLYDSKIAANVTKTGQEIIQKLKNIWTNS